MFETSEVSLKLGDASRGARRGCARDRRGRLSQTGRFGEDSLLQVGAQSADGQHLNSTAKELSEVLLQADDVEQRATRFNLDEQVDVAVGTIISVKNRPEHTDVAGAMTSCHRENLVSSRPQFIDRHVIMITAQ